MPPSSSKTPSPPSTASSASSSSEIIPLSGEPAPSTSSNKRLNPPKPLFFIDKNRSAADMVIEEERRPDGPPSPSLPRHDPFRTPDSSVPGTPRTQVNDPFSPPASVLNMSILDNSSTISNGNATAPMTAHSRMQSRISVNSSMRSNADLPGTGANSTIGGGAASTARNGRPGGTVAFRDSFMSPPPLTKRTPSMAHLPPTSSRLSLAPSTRQMSSKRMRSTMLSADAQLSKPWINAKDVHGRIAYFLTYAIALLGIAGSAIRCWTAWKGVERAGNLCLVMQDDFNVLDTEYTWTREVDMSGFGNGEFEMTTASSNNSFVDDGKLYIVPTLTSDVIGFNNVLDGYTYNITGCTNSNLTACGAVSNATSGTVIPPVMSARLTTKNSHHITYGKVEIRAKLPVGDWIWPALWMLPVDDSYGPWPLSGEIDIMESRGNGVDYKAQGRDVVRGSLNWGPFTWLNGVAKTYGWWSTRRSTFAEDFHTYTLEWSPNFIRIYVDTRLHKMLDVSFLKETFFERGDFPPYVANGSQTIQTPNPWVEAVDGESPSDSWRKTSKGGNGKNAAPFNKPFYLIMNVAVGGTNGWFPDGIGGKPWLDGSHVAMSTFARAQSQWYKTWPQNPKDRALVVDSVKMWQAC